MNKKPFFTFALICCSFFGHSLFADRVVSNFDGINADGNGIYEEGEAGGCPSAYVSGPCICYCPVTRFKPKYYCEDRCVQEPYTVQKKQCRYVDQYYTKKHTRYVPQYYTKTFCRQVPECYEKTYCRKVPEYYTVCETKYRTKTVRDTKCKYEPYTVWEKRCVDAPSDGCPTCPSNGGQFAQPIESSYAQPVRSSGCSTCR